MKYILSFLLIITNTFLYKWSYIDDNRCSCNNKDIIVKGKDGDKLIAWSNRKFITWYCFEGKAPPKKFKNFSAITFVCHQWDKFTVYEDSITFNLNNYFIIDSSWVDTKKQNDNLLNHEIRHFDLAEINTRKMRKELNIYISINEYDTRCYFDYLENNKYSKSLQALMDEYDSETNHGIDSKVQQRWNKKIDSLLNVYKDYSNPHIVIKKKW